ncbi:glycosyltransferase [Spirosoma jeollabukense]
MKNVAIITDIDFWRHGSGNRVRIRSLISYLSHFFNLTVVLINQKLQLTDNFKLPNVRFVSINNYGRKVQQHLVRYILKKTQCEYCIVEYVHLTYLVEILPKSTIKFLDTHDIISQRNESFLEAGYEDHYAANLNFQEELDLYKIYDYVLMIKTEDYNLIASVLGKSKVLLVPHASPIYKPSLRHKAFNVGYIASTYLPNIDGINWFINSVWKNIKTSESTLHIYGNVCSHVNDCENVKKHGFISNVMIAYESVDIIVNPVRFGAGMKIKNVEALCAGLPLLTTTHGISGMDDAKDVALLAADSAEQFKELMQLLLSSYDLRFRLSEQAHEYARTKFSAEVCYKSLIDRIVAN